MPLTSDMKLDTSSLDPDAISERTTALNESLIALGKKGPKWYEVGAEKYRQMRWNGETAFPKPTIIDSGKDIKLPSRDVGRDIPCRIFTPDSGSPKAVFYHIHGGGWVLQTEHYQDLMLNWLAQHCQLIVVSVGYRLAPEDPYPAGNDDCEDIAAWLIDHAQDQYGAPLAFMGGDSAGAHLSAVTCFRLLKTKPSFAFKALVLNFGCFDLAGLTSHVHHFDLPLILTKDIMEHYIAAYVPSSTEADRRHPDISPLYANMRELNCPPAIFTCGTLDLLLDDSVMMATKWNMGGGEAVLKLYPGAPHGFVFFPIDGTPETQKALDDIKVFLEEHL